MVTLAVLSGACRLNMNEAAEAELARVHTKIERIRAKQAAKAHGTPLPGWADLPAASNRDLNQKEKANG